MLSRFSEVLQSAADVLAPPASRLVDFQYHWKLIQNFYITESTPMKVHVDNTRIPLHLHQMLQFLVDEETENSDEKGPCLIELVCGQLGIPSCLTALAQADRPPGLRATVLAWYTALLRRCKLVPIHESALLIPIQKLLISCQNNHASPTEKEEVELLLTLCGLVRKQPNLAYLFLSKQDLDEGFIPTVSVFTPLSMKTPKQNTLFECESVPMSSSVISIVSQPSNESKREDLNIKKTVCQISSSKALGTEELAKHNLDNNATFLLMDLLLAYLQSADNHIVLRACEGVMIVASLPDEKIARLVVSTNLVPVCLVEILIDKYRALPYDIDPCDIDQLNITWGYANQEFSDKYNKAVGLRELTAFFSWLDYFDTLAKECHIILAMSLARTLKWHFLGGELELGLIGRQHAVLVTAILGKCLKSIDSPELLNQVSKWLVGEYESVATKRTGPVLQILIDNCCDGDVHLCLETLRLFETMIEKASDHIFYCLVIGYVEGRGYHSPPRLSSGTEDEERERLNSQSLQHERESNRQTMKKVCEGRIDDTLAHWPDTSHTSGISTVVSLNNIHKIINSFLLLLPRDLLSDPNGVGYEQYMQDAHRHYLNWVELTSSFNWPTEATFPDPSTSSTHSYDSRPEADLHSNLSPCRETDIRSNVPEMKSVGISVDLISTKHQDHNDSGFIGDVSSNKLPQCHNNKSQDEKTSTEKQKINNSLNLETKKNNYQNLKLELSSVDSNMETKSETDRLFDVFNDLGKCEQNLASSFHQQLVLSPKDRTSLSELAEDDDMTFDEGPFLRMLYKLLLNMHHQPYQINLQLTAIFSKLAMLPHPYLHEYLLNPVLPAGKNIQTLYRTLQKLTKVFLSQIPKVKHFHSVIEETRQHLLGDAHTDNNDKNDPLFESLIVVEEFCKELAAISFVKYHHACQLSGI